MGTYVVIKPNGEITRVPGGKSLDIHKLYELIGCHTVEVTPVQYEGRKRDCWLDEEGLFARPLAFNPKVREFALDYWGKRGVPPARIQSFAGTGVIWLPRG